MHNIVIETLLINMNYNVQLDVSNKSVIMFSEESFHAFFKCVLTIL